MADYPRGRVELFEHTGRLLAHNPLGDPTTRATPVYLPPSYDGDAERRYPVVYVLAGFTGQGRMMLHESAWGENLPQRMDRLIGMGACPEAILVMPDCMTRFGGSQYVDSTATGPYESYLVEELVPAVDDRYRTTGTECGRGLLGKSSGGFGAMRLGFRHPELFPVIGSHAGDAAFEYCYQPDFPEAAMALEAAGGREAWFEAFLGRPKQGNADHLVINVLGMAASYSPNPDAALGLDLPFDSATMEIVPEVWDRWLAHDPARSVLRDDCGAARLRGAFIDCGTKDQFRLYVGARRVARGLRDLGVDVVHEEFSDNHFSISYRYDRSIPWIVERLATSPV